MKNEKATRALRKIKGTRSFFGLAKNQVERRVLKVWNCKPKLGLYIIGAYAVKN